MAIFLEELKDISVLIMYFVLLSYAIYKRQYKLEAPLFTLFVFYVFVIILESIGYALYKFRLGSNIAVYNLLIVGGFVFYWYWAKLSTTSYKWFFDSMLVFGLVIFTWDVYLGLNILAYKTIVLTTVIILVFIFLYFKELIQDDSTIRFELIPNFWFFSGSLIFHFGLIPIAIFEEMYENYYSIFIDSFRVLSLIYTLFILKCFSLVPSK